MSEVGVQAISYIYTVIKNWAAFPLFWKYEKNGEGGVLMLARRAQLTWSSVAPQYSAGEAPKPSMQPLQEVRMRVRTVRGGVCCQKGRIKGAVRTYLPQTILL
jgi:hypothetical protein